MVDLEMDDGLAVDHHRPPARPQRHLPGARWANSTTALDALETTVDARALAITGAGDRAFVSGGDLKELSALRTEARRLGDGLADAGDLRPDRRLPRPR